MKKNDFPYFTTRFFESYLPESRNVSENTILSYRDTFSKLLAYLRDCCSIEPDKVTFKDINHTTIENFLSYLENEQHCSLATRNQRLAALKSFFRYVEVERPDLLFHTPLFYNSRREKLSRSGVAYILSKYIERANENGGNISTKITPHCLRHSKAMHMVEAGINLVYIRDYLGHESIDTTQVYAKANPEVRRKAISKMEAKTAAPSMPDWNDNPDIMNFLRSLK